MKGLFVLFMRGMVCLKEKVCEGLCVCEGANVSIKHMYIHTGTVYIQCTSMPTLTVLTSQALKFQEVTNVTKKS